MSNKVLIVTYYWPPDGGPGVQRWLKFVKYLPALGWKPVVFTPSNSTFSITDKSFIKDIPEEAVVVKLPIWEPHDLFFKISSLFGKKKLQQSDFISTGKASLFKKVSTWVRGNFFIPDARVFWVRPATKFLTKYLAENDINIIVTTGPPHSLHLIGLKLKQKFPNLKWIADFRDPWSEWDMLDSLAVSGAARKIHRRMEKSVVKAADRVITISPYYVKRFEAIGGRNVDLITNGFDHEDFLGIKKIDTAKMTIRHVGNIDELRDPRPVMEAIKELCVRDAEFKSNVAVEFVGNVNSAFKSYVAADPVLTKVTKFINHLPHNELVQLYGSTEIQLLVLAHLALATGNIPGKVFEYLASGNNILALGAADGDVAAILEETHAGKVFDRADRDGINTFLLTAFHNWKAKTPAGSRAVNKYSRAEMTAKLDKILRSLQS